MYEKGDLEGRVLTGAKQQENFGVYGGADGEKRAWDQKKSKEPGGVSLRPARARQAETFHTGGCLQDTIMPGVPFEGAAVAAS